MRFYFKNLMNNVTNLTYKNAPKSETYNIAIDTLSVETKSNLFLQGVVGTVGTVTGLELYLNNSENISLLSSLSNPNLDWVRFFKHLHNGHSGKYIDYVSKNQGWPENHIPQVSSEFIDKVYEYPKGSEQLNMVFKEELVELKTNQIIINKGNKREKSI